MSVDVHVELPTGVAVRAGTIRETGSPGRSVVEFRYDGDYVRLPDAYPLSSDLPLVEGSFTPSGRRSMLGGIADAQPDLWGRRLIDSHRRARARDASETPTRATELEVLLAVPDDTRQGALRFRHDGEFVAQRESTMPGIVDLASLIDAARAFETGVVDDEQLHTLVQAGSSMGGARPKATVRLASRALAIAKLPRDDDFGDGPAWEAVALELARRSGVAVPRFDLHRVGPRSVLVVERFDRVADRRIGYLSADSMLVKQPGEVVDYVTLAETMAPVSAGPAADGEQLFTRVAVSLLVNNIDDHMKNHGFIRARAGWRLAPAFDITPYYRHGFADSTPISSSDDPRDRDIRLLVERADSFGVTASRAVAVISRVESATSTWRAVAAGFGIEPEGADAMAAAFESKNRYRARSIQRAP